MNSLIKDKRKLMILLVALLILFSLFSSFNLFGKNTQLIVGSIVNALLFISARNISDNKKLVTLSLLPSVVSMSCGLIFNGLTMYTKIMIPFIWLGNLSLVFSVKNKKLNDIFAILIKVGIIYSGFLIMSNIINIPSTVSNTLSYSFSFTQLITATIGLLLANIIEFKR